MSEQIETEAELRAAHVETFEEHGWNVEEEVWADGRLGRVDIIVTTEDLPRIGLELKCMVNAADGQKTAEAIQQLEKYRRLTFSGEKIKYWAFSPFYERKRTGSELGYRQDGKKQLQKAMFNNLGYGYLLIDRRRPVISFGKGGKYGINVARPPPSVPHVARRKVENERLALPDEDEN